MTVNEGSMAYLYARVLGHLKEHIQILNDQLASWTHAQGLGFLQTRIHSESHDNTDVEDIRQKI